MAEYILTSLRHWVVMARARVQGWKNKACALMREFQIEFSPRFFMFSSAQNNLSNQRAPLHYILQIVYFKTV